MHLSLLSIGQFPQRSTGQAFLSVSPATALPELRRCLAQRYSVKIVEGGVQSGCMRGVGGLPRIYVCRACVEHHERPLSTVGVEAGGQEEQQRAAESLWAELKDTGPGARRAGGESSGRGKEGSRLKAGGECGNSIP